MKNVVCCVVACFTLLLGELSAQTSYPEIKGVYEKDCDALSIEDYAQELKSLDARAAELVGGIADLKERKIATLLWHTYQRENIYRFWKAYRGTPSVLKQLRPYQLSTDVDVPEMELLSEEDLNYVLDWYFRLNKFTNAYLRIKDCLYGIKSEKVRNVYALGLLERDLRVNGIGKDMGGVFEAFRCCSKTPATVARVNELEKIYMPVGEDVIPPDIALPDDKGEMFSLRAQEEKYVFICVWSLDSADGANELDVFAGAKQVYDRWGESGIVYVNIAMGKEKDLDKWKKTLKEKEQTGWMVNLFCDTSKSSFPKDYVVETLPRYIFVNPDGYLRSAWFASPRDVSLFKQVFKANTMGKYKRIEI